MNLSKKTRTSEININLVDSYYLLLKNLSTNNKLELIAKLSKSMTASQKTKDSSWKSLSGALVLEQSVDEFIDELRNDRKFVDKSLDL